MKRRVVITGMGCLTPVGNDVATSWTNLLEGVSGIDYARRIDLSTFPSKIAGEVKNFDPNDYIDNKNLLKYTTRAHQLGIAAGTMAMEDSQLYKSQVDSSQIGVVLGMSLQYPETDILNHYLKFGSDNKWDYQTFANGARIPPTHVFHRSGQPVSCVLAKLLKASGPNMVTHTACASATHAIAQAYRLVQRGDAAVVFTGGTEAISGHLIVAGFTLLRALSTREVEPQKASRPFDAERDGFVMAEAAGVLVLEELNFARQRGARIYAELIGAGTSANAYSIVDSSKGPGPRLAVERALEDANINCEDIDYINAHGTSTKQNDIAETRAIKSVFGNRAYQVPLSSTKACIGMPFAGVGAVDAIATTMAVRENRIPPTMNYEYKDPECDLDYVPNQKREKIINYAMSNSFGFGGQNGCLVLAKYID